MAKALFPYSFSVFHSRSLNRKTRCASHLNLIAGLSLCAVLVGCGGGSSSGSSSTSNPVAVTLLPGAATVVTGTTEQFTATVTNASNTAVTYEVNNVAGGAAATGTISTAGLYTAPAQVPNPNTVEIEAISQQDTTQKGTANVTITLPPPNTHIDILPAAPVLQTGAVQTFTAAINGQPASVTWTLSCSSPAAIDCGTINTATGVYTAPLTPPLGGNVHLTATDNNPKDNTPPGGASITVQFSPGTLNGQYAFSLLGTGTAMAGTLTMNGAGAITAGSADLSTGTGFTVAAGSTYTLGTDGRGVITLNTSAGTFTFAFAVVNHSHGLLVRFDSSTATGTIDLQDPSKFTLAAVTGNYTIAFANRGGSLATQVAGAGAFATNGAGTVSSAELDLNSGGTPSFISSVSGSMGTPSSSSGRGTLTFNSSNFAYYILDATHLKLVELGSSAATGDIFQQNLANPKNFNSSFAATLSGFSSAGPVGEGAVFALDGSGNLRNATFDTNLNGTVQNNSGVSSTYSAPDAAGRITFTIPAGGTYAAYTEASGALNLLEIDSNVASGTAFPQQSSAFSNAATFGNFALSATGMTVGSPAEVDMVGQWLPNGGAAFTGVLDVNDNGSPSHGAPNSLSGSYPIIGGNGRAPSGSMQASNFQPSATVNFYVVDANTVLFVELDSNRVLTGIVQKQF